jgi:hypothetical protein
MNLSEIQPDTVESLLSGVRFEPSPVFNNALLNRMKFRFTETAGLLRPNQINRLIWFFNGTRRKVASAAIIFCMIMVSLFLSVPGVWAQVAYFVEHFGVKLPFTTQGLVISTFEPLAPEYVPTEMTYFFSANYDRPTYSELRYFSQDKFIVISESPTQEDETLPSGKSISVGKYAAVLQEDLSGPIMLAAPLQQVWRTQVKNGTGGGGGGGGGGGASIEDAPMQLDYTDGIQITWFQSGLRIDLLTNLPLEDALKVAESLKPAEKLPEK